MADKIVFKRHESSIFLCVRDEELETMLTITMFIKRFGNFSQIFSTTPKTEAEIYARLDGVVNDINYIIHGDNEAKKLLLFKSLGPILEKYGIYVDNYVNDRYDDQAENRATTALYNVLGKRRPKTQSQSTLKDIIGVMYKHRIKTYEM